MAVPGIPSMQKAGPQSFSAPQAEPTASDAETSPASAFRASSLFKMPNFGSPILTGGAAMTKNGSSKQGEAATQPPPVPARPGAEEKHGAETATSALGLTQMDRRRSSGAETRLAGKGSSSTQPSTTEGTLEDDRTKAEVESTFAEVAKALSD